MSSASSLYAPSWADGLPYMLGAIDLGTNNCRLMIAEVYPPAPAGFRVQEAFSRIVRLGEGYAKTGRLSEAAMARTLEAISHCAERMRQYRVGRVRAVATEACRKAENGTAFLAHVQRETGMQLEVISSAEEARLAMLGCAPLLNPEKPLAIIFDIGGGSTEITWAKLQSGDKRPSLIDHVSIGQGVVGLTERYGTGRVSDADYQAMVGMVCGALQTLDAKHDISAAVRDGNVQMAGCSGTITTLGAAHKGLARYQRDAVDGMYMDRAPALDLIAKLRVLDYEGRAGFPSIGYERADLMVAGCAILQAILELWPVSFFRIGDRGLRDGIMTDLAAV